MIKSIATAFLAAGLFAAPAMAADVGHDCAEGEDEVVLAPQQTPMPVPPPPAPGS